MPYVLARPCAPDEVITARPRCKCGCGVWYDPPWRVPRHELLAAMRARNGALLVRVMCVQCGGWRSTNLPHALLRVPARELPIVYDALRRGCAVSSCVRIGVETHHWAPRARFSDADAWPTSSLCTHHHRRWHARMKSGA